MYKPKGSTLAAVLNQLKVKLLAEAGMLKPSRKKRKQMLKIGHGGILDIDASGVLVVDIGKGTKMLSSMLASSKKYTAVGEFGKATDTLDFTGKVTEKNPYDLECGGSFYVRSLVNDISKELSSCATMQELTRTKQGSFILEEHVLYEDKWTIDEIAKSLECCMPLLQEEPSRKKLKTELSEEHTMNSGDK